ncbi:MAG: Ig domain protein group 2 domain protein, partial [Bacteroidetes bacterium]|nr:Ig domain protein group 2 domain protein [Bacteroidota bacterium]
MKIKLFPIRKVLVLVAILSLSPNLFSQDNSKQLVNRLKFLELSAKDSLAGFDDMPFKTEALNRGFFGKEYSAFMYSVKRGYVNQKYNLGVSMINAKPLPPQAPVSLMAPPCVNEDFESSTAGGPYTTLTGWTVSEAQNGFGSWNAAMTVYTYYNTCSVSVYPATSWTQAPNEVWIRNTPIADANFPGGIPNSPLGGTKVLQLNDNIASLGEVSRVSQTFPVTSGNALFQYAYAACFNGTGHLCCDQPFLTIQVRNCSNVILACPNVDIIASGPSCTSGTPGFLTNASGYLYKNWTVQSIDLTPFIGSCVTIEVIVGDCSGWAHFGYCYFDAKCSPMTITVNNTQFPAGTAATTVAACGVTTGTMSAPTGLGPYNWQGPAGSGITNNTNQTITTSTSGNYTLTMNPAGACAPITKTVTLVFTPSPLATFNTVSGCNTFTFTNTGSAAPSVQTYSFIGTSPPGSFTTTATTTVVPFPTAGTYTVMHVVTNTAGCVTTASTVITAGAPPNAAFAIPTPTQCLNGNSYNFNATQATGTHTYNFNPAGGAPANGSAANYNGAFTAPGTYTVNHTINFGGCTAFASSVIVVNPHPSLTVVPFNAACGQNTGSITINNTTGAGQTVVSFSMNGTTIPSQTVTGLGAGLYTIGLTNNFGCFTNTTTTIGNTPGVTALGTTSINPTCGNANGSIGLGVVT